MTTMSVSLTLDRIRGASVASPIAVFKSDKPGCVNSVFARTVVTHRLIAEKHPDLIGVFDESSHNVAQQIAPHVRPGGDA